MPNQKEAKTPAKSTPTAKSPKKKNKKADQQLSKVGIQ